jgi:hypothetical protein
MESKHPALRAEQRSAAFELPNVRQNVVNVVVGSASIQIEHHDWLERVRVGDALRCRVGEANGVMDFLQPLHTPLPPSKTLKVMQPEHIRRHRASKLPRQMRLPRFHGVAWLGASQLSLSFLCPKIFCHFLFVSVKFLFSIFFLIFFWFPS